MIIWGFRSRNKVLGQTQSVCRQCGQNGYHTVVMYRRWFTLFFIPIIPFNKRYIDRCNLCGVQFKMPKEQAEAIFSSQPSPLKA